MLYFLKGSKRWFALSILLACLVSVLDLINPRIIGYTVDSVLDQKESELPALAAELVRRVGGSDFLRSHLYYIAGAVLAAALLGALCRYLFHLTNSLGAEKLVLTMRNTLFRHILKLPYAWHGTQQTGDIIQRCTSDVEMIKRFLSEQMAGLFRISLLIILAVTSMIRIHPLLTLAAAAFIPIIVGYSLFFHSRIGSSFEKVDTQEGKLSAIAQENLTGVRVVRAFGREQYERSRFETQNDVYTKMWVELMRLLSAFFSVGDLFSGLQILTVVALGAVFCVRDIITPGNYIAFVSYNAMLTWPVRGLGRIISEMSKAGISIDRLRFIMNSEEEKDDENAGTPPIQGDICFEHITFSYEGTQQEALHDVSFTVREGTTFGILGSTGSGKSTLMLLLDRLYELPEQGGHITIGGTDIRSIKASWLRSKIGMVLQEPYLFSRTLAENIAITEREETDLPRVRRAARTASLDETVERFAKGYDTYVGERGVTLSGGQKQRTAIAQMLMRKAPIMVFDDSLSAVDAETDAKIRSALKESTQGATVILIAHRITTLMNADYIIVMDRGRIAEEGTHEELLALGGIYRRIYDLQTQDGSDTQQEQA